MRNQLLMAAFMLGPALVGMAGTAEVAEAGHVCDPYPLDRCGAFQRETVIFCYLPAGGSPTMPDGYLSPTDTNVVAIGGPDVVNVGTDAKGRFYARLTPTEDFVDDPNAAPLPFGTLYEETNNLGGLQPKTFYCANLIWFAECEPAQWMGPFNVKAKAPDELVA